MKKIFIFCMMALVAMCGLNSCSDDCNHEFIEYDYNKALVGTWTCLKEGYAEALVINADGSVLSTGVEDGEYWENIKGNIKTVNNKMTLIFEDDDNFEGRFEMLSGEAFTIYEEDGESLTYRYCKEDLSEEIVGMWVCTDSPLEAENDMVIQTYQEDGYCLKTGFSEGANDFVVNNKAPYKVVGDLIFLERPADILTNGKVSHIACLLNYFPNGTALGDILVTPGYAFNGNKYESLSTSWLRIKQGLSLTGKAYAYSTAYVSNAKGKDEEFSILGHPFNMANIKTANFDVLFHSELFCAVLKENSIKQLFRSNGQDIEIEIPITVEGNKVTLHMGNEDLKLKDVEMYMFQDADDCQLHMYMHTDAFINYFANMEVITLQVEGKIGSTQAEIDAVYANMKTRIESINVSFVMKAIK